MVIQIYNKFGGFLLLYSIIYNLSLEMSDEPDLFYDYPQKFDKKVAALAKKTYLCHEFLLRKDGMQIN